jgi:hypothetical protein
MFCAPVLLFGGTEGVRSRFHVLRSQTCFWLCGGRSLLFSCFALTNSFSAVPWASTPIFMFYAPEVVSRCAEGVGSRFNVLPSQTRFRRYRGHRVPFSYFTLPDSFSAGPRATGPVFMFCAPELVFGGTEGVRSRFHVLYAGTLFGGNEGVGSHFHILRSRTHFRRYRGRQVSFSCFARPNSFSAVPRASAPVFIFCAPVLVFGGTESVRSHFSLVDMFRAKLA